MTSSTEGLGSASRRARGRAGRGSPDRASTQSSASGPAAGGSSVLEEQLAVLRQRPEVVGDERLELVDDLAQRVLGRDDVGRRRPRLGLDRARLVGLVLRVLERVDGVDERVGEAGDLLADRVDALATTAPRSSWPR